MEAGAHVNAIRITGGWLYWLAYQLLALQLTAFGIVIVGVLAYFRAWRTRESRLPAFRGRTVTAWRFEPLTTLFGNDEDGVTGPDWYLPDADPRWRAFVWSALRNSANGMRLLPGAFVVLEHAPTYREHRRGYVATYGWRQCVTVRIGGSRFRLGWLIPENAAAGYRAWPIFGRRDL